MAENGTPASSSVAATKRRAEDGAEVITLAQPRPGTVRRTNEYIETPLRAGTGRPPPPPAKDVSRPRRPVTAQPKKATDKSSDGESSLDSDHRHPTGAGTGEPVDGEESIIRRGLLFVPVLRQGTLLPLGTELRGGRRRGRLVCGPALLLRPRPTMHAVGMPGPPGPGPALPLLLLAPQGMPRADREGLRPTHRTGLSVFLPRSDQDR